MSIVDITDADGHPKDQGDPDENERTTTLFVVAAIVVVELVVVVVALHFFKN
jgi:hypothetical protein